MPGRRAVLGGLALLPVTAEAVQADDAALAAAIREAIGDKVPVEAGLTLRLPPVAENGGQVPLTGLVDIPMT